MRVFRLFFVRAPALLLAVSLLLSLVFPVPSYAGVSTPSDADAWEGDEGIMTLDSGLSVRKIENTINFSGAYLAMTYNNTRGGQTMAYTQVDSSGHFSLQRPNDFVSVRRIELQLVSGNLPVTGNYAFAFNIIPESGITYVNSYATSAIYTRFIPLNSNAIGKTLFYITSSNHQNTDITTSDNGILYTHVGKDGTIIEYSTFGEYYAYTPSIGFINSNIAFRPYVDVSSISFPFNGHVRVAFTSTGTQPVFTTPGSAVSSENLQQDISNAVGNISSTVSQVVSGVSDVAGKVSGVTSAIQALPAQISASMEPHYNNVLTQLHHITEQLHAFWNQLAAYFNDKLIPQMIADTDRIVDAINNLDLEVDVSFSELTSVLNKNHREQLDNDNKNHQAQLDNDDKNADAIMNSYENGSFNSSNQKLSDSLAQYESEEGKLLGQVQGNIDGMEYVNPFTQFTAPLADVSFFLTGIYTGLGAFNIPIAFSLTLTIALLCIGWYRFRGG